MKKPSSTTVAVRLPSALNRTFTATAAKFGGRSQVMRELIQALCENRLTIEPPKIEGTIYDYRKQP